MARPRPWRTGAIPGWIATRGKPLCAGKVVTGKVQEKQGLSLTVFTHAMGLMCISCGGSYVNKSTYTLVPPAPPLIALPVRYIEEA